MTTDIKELMQELKAASNNASSGEWVKESGGGWEACCSTDDQANGGFIIAHFEGPNAEKNREYVQAANPANTQLLIEVLEAKDSTIAEQVETIAKQEKWIKNLEETMICATDRAEEWERMAISNREACVELQSRAEAAERALTLALPAMEFMGDTLNNLDAVCSEDVEFVTPAFDAVRSVLDGIQIQGGE